MTIRNVSNVPTDVQRAAKNCSAYLQDLEARYSDRCSSRNAINLPVIAFCGHGRAGKDTAAAWFGASTAIEYCGSVSSAVCPLVANALEQPTDVAFAERHEDRQYWFEFCNELRRCDPTLLVRMTLGLGDVVAGIRGDIEFQACVQKGLVDLTVWVENPSVDIDPTLEYTRADCDIVIDNCTTKVQFYRKLQKLAEILRLA